MKKILSLLVLLVAFTSCEEDVKFNNPAVQGFKNEELWRATEFSAVKSGNSVTLTATNGFETVVLKMDNPQLESQHTLGVDGANMASYTLNVEGVEEYYETGTGVGNGLIKMSGDARYMDLAKGLISGEFYFNALNTEGETVNYQKGVFFRHRFRKTG